MGCGSGFAPPCLSARESSPVQVRFPAPVGRRSRRGTKIAADDDTGVLPGLACPQFSVPHVFCRVRVQGLLRAGLCFVLG